MEIIFNPEEDRGSGLTSFIWFERETFKKLVEQAIGIQEHEQIDSIEVDETGITVSLSTIGEE